MNSFYDTLLSYSQSDMYPFHMPGHKRNGTGVMPESILKLDITEIEGFDNLHKPQGILREMQEKAAALYGADESFFMINGSTGGILSAISSALPRGGHILIARNCHKSVYHGAYLRNLTISYLYPRVIEEYDICEAINSEQVRHKLDQEPGIQAVLIVSPTYEGRIADIAAIADIVHERGIPLIVDEAHGAHLGFSREFSAGSCRQGADLVIHSIHKTLTSMTQTAILHVNGSLIDRHRLRRFLSVYQSSSPSYVLMASMEAALRLVREEGSLRLGLLAERYAQMKGKLEALKCICILPSGPNQDIGKLLISVKKTCLSGTQLYDILLQEYHLQMEMAAETFVLAMFTMGDKEEGFERLTRALLEIDHGLWKKRHDTAGGGWRLSGNEEVLSRPQKPDKSPGNPWKDYQEQKIPLYEAWDADTEDCRLEESCGRIAGEFVNLYPPGVPVLVPGEIISLAIATGIRSFLDKGLNVQGVEKINDEYVIKVLLTE